MTNITRWTIFLIPINFTILMTTKTLKLVQSKQNTGLIIPMYIINLPLDTSM